MALEVDTLLDRRRLTRRLAVWRALAILIVIAAVGAAVYWTVSAGGSSHIARLPIRGAIVSDSDLIDLIEDLGEDDSVAGVVVTINSPGGTTVGGERLYNALRDVAAVKPVVAQIDTLGASAAYMTALATDHIVAHRSSLTGSIGVLIQYGQISEMLDHLGIQVSKVDSGPLKAEPNPFEPTDPDAVAALQSIVDDSYAWFLGMVVERRGLTEADARRLADGRIFTGHQALEEKLIDEIGGEDTAIAWMESERGIAKDLPVKTYTTKDDGDFSFTAHMAERVVDGVFAALGLPLPSTRPTASVDGLWSLWQASITSDLKVTYND
ncbi:signal peptide peptidase SppA [Acuticoccus mangrovi]|uniref:Signal peptide peptidase SppA n=1 Tax=Acuticoccus mangrovi TaxID=2796142 RepID=A0A934IPK6_9HYPH|nr:signal peptide peptidase SppA [Acuticoccus mangrovi]MBJ3776243.1 signal peptide peptidase SppA [Acuticoccus mangrovi]